MNIRSAASFLLVGTALLLVPNLRELTDFPVYVLVFLYSTFYWITQATSWNILSGYSGYFSFGQSAFVGTGLYATAILVAELDVNFFLAVPLAGVVAMLLALGVGFVAFRLRSLRGEIFTLLTFVVAFVLAAVAQLSHFIDGGQGRQVTQPDYPEIFGSYNDLIYRMGVIAAVGAVAVAYAVQHSRLGRGLFAIRDDEDVAEAFGAPTFRYKMTAFAISGFIAGAAGGINSLQVSYLTTDTTFNFIVPLFVILMSTLGGRNHWMGPVIGAVIIYSLQERLAGAGFADSSQILLGAVLALTILFVPEGLYSRLRATWRLALTLFIGVILLQQVVGLFESVLAQFFLALVVILPFLLVPPSWLGWLGWFKPREVAPRMPPRPQRPATADAPLDMKVSS